MLYRKCCKGLLKRKFCNVKLCNVNLCNVVSNNIVVYLKPLSGRFTIFSSVFKTQHILVYLQSGSGQQNSYVARTSAQVVRTSCAHGARTAPLRNKLLFFLRQMIV